jgi:hypothetical protein
VRDDGDDWRGGGYFVWDADCGTVTLCRRLVFLDPNGPTGVQLTFWITVSTKRRPNAAIDANECLGLRSLEGAVAVFGWSRLSTTFCSWTPVRTGTAAR